LPCSLYSSVAARGFLFLSLSPLPLFSLSLSIPLEPMILIVNCECSYSTNFLKPSENDMVLTL
jgi:hypothetical protein